MSLDQLPSRRYEMGRLVVPPPPKRMCGSPVATKESILAALKRWPGSSAPEIAARLKASPTNVAAALRKLEQRGKVASAEGFNAVGRKCIVWRLA